MERVPDEVRRMQAAVLRSVRSDLDLVVAPELSSDAARMALQLASEMLAFVELAHSEYPALARRAGVELGVLRERARQLAKRAGVGEGTAPAQPATASELMDDEVLAAEQAGLARTIAALLAARATLAPEHHEELQQLLRDALGAEQRRLLEEHALLGNALAARADPVAAVECELTPERVQAFAAERLAHLDPGSVEQLERVPGGYSKDTWKLGFSRGIAGHRALILRRDLPFGPGENSVTEEHALLEHLAAAGLAVPPPLLLEPDPRFLGRPFLLFPRLPGAAVFGDWHAPDAERRALVLEVARQMASLHSLDPFACAAVDPALRAREPQEIVRDHVRLWRDKWVRRRNHPSLILEIAFDWLLRNAPATLPRVSFVHGDISFRNTLIEQGRLVALLDWEFWHLGDPMEDLSYFRLVAEPYVEWDAIRAAYEQAGGPAYDATRADYYAVWRSVRNGTTTTTAWHGFLSGAYPASKAAYQGVSLYRLFLRDVATQLGRTSL